MRATISRLVVPALAAGLIGMLALAGTAAAKKPCSPSGGSLAPRLTSPCAGARIPAGHNVTWKVTDTNPNSGQFHPYLNVTRNKPRNGRLADDHGGNGIYAQLKRVSPGHFTYQAKRFTFPGYWLVTKGTWYVQVQQIDSNGKNDTVDSPVETIHIT